MKKVEKIEILEDSNIKVWYSTHTMQGDVTVNYSQGQDLIVKGDKEKVLEFGLEDLTDELWTLKKVVKKVKK
jgi:hypothetical protein|tara:strand:+ start:157 stop:372 length:216 start_codon:yes stop_codon:yes gene_type:complete